MFFTFERAKTGGVTKNAIPSNLFDSMTSLQSYSRESVMTLTKLMTCQSGRNDEVLCSCKKTQSFLNRVNQ